MKTDSWLYSDTFLKRCFAYMGYYMVAHLIIQVAVIAAFFALSISLVAPGFQN